MYEFFTTVLVEPIYNMFVALIAWIPGHDAGIAIVLLTLIIRAIFLPTFAQAIRTQHAMRRVEGDLAKINEAHKNDAMLRGQKTMELFKEHNIRPFASMAAILIQLPVFIALYMVFLKEGFPSLAHELLYAITPIPEAVGTLFLGVVSLTSVHLIPLALFVAVLQYIQSKLSAGTLPQNLSPEREQMLRMQRSMLLYFFPFMMGFISYTLPAAAGIYLATNTLVSIGQELAIARKLRGSAA